jgi:hypothetical protein
MARKLSWCQLIAMVSDDSYNAWSCQQSHGSKSCPNPIICGFAAPNSDFSEDRSKISILRDTVLSSRRRWKLERSRGKTDKTSNCYTIISMANTSNVSLKPLCSVFLLRKKSIENEEGLNLHKVNMSGIWQIYWNLHSLMKPIKCFSWRKSSIWNQDMK